MTKKDRIRTFGVFYVGRPKKLDSNLHQLVIEQHWYRCEARNDAECSAQIFDEHVRAECAKVTERLYSYVRR